MTVAAGDTKIREQGNGSKTAFDFPFKIFSASDIVAQKISAAGVVTTGVLNTDYTVSFVAGVAGGTVTWSVAPSASEDSFLYLALSETQPTPIPNVGSLQKIVIENALDRAVLLIKQLSEQVARSFKFAISSEVDPETAGIIPDPEAGKVLGWNTLGTALENKALVITSTSYPGVLGAGADASKPASPGVNDVYFATDTNKWYRCISAGTWTTVNNSGIATDMVAAATTNIGAGTGDFVNITGNTGITSFGTIAAGIRIWTRFAGTPQITHNATSMILPGGANITAAAGDVACWESLGSGNWRCLVYTRASGLPVVSPTLASQAEAEAGVENTKTMTPLRVLQAIAAQRLEVVYGTYTGDGVDNRDITIGFFNTSKSAKFVMVLKRSSGGGHWMFTGDTSGQAPQDGTAQTAGIKSFPSANVFRVGTNAEANGAGVVFNFIAVG